MARSVVVAGVQRWEIPTPFPVGTVNAYYLPGPEPTLVDVGPRTPPAEAALAQHLRTVRVDQVVITHHHVDHMGLAASVVRTHGARVAAHEQEAEILDHWGARKQEREADYAEGLSRAGVPESHRERMRYGGRKVEAYAEGLQVARRLREGDRIQAGAHELEVLHTPGHTAGSILLRERGNAFTFSGDTLLERITPNALSVRLSERNALPQYLATLHRLHDLPLGTVLPGHGSPFGDAPQVISRALRHAEVRQSRLRALAAERPGTAYDLTVRLFHRLPENQLFLAVSETLGHLEALRGQGRIQVQAVAGVDRYAAA